LIDARFVPIEKWPGEASKHSVRSRFKVTYAKLLDDLESELRHLRAKDIVIQAYYTREQIRNDGWPRSGTRPSKPGVVLSFIKREQVYEAGRWVTGEDEIAFPCDTYSDFEGNLRAISLTLSALRDIDRYGVSQHHEQYKGWAKLPPAPDSMDLEPALSFLSLHSGMPVNPETFKQAYRAAARKLHPDNQTTGDHHQFALLGQAKTTIEDRCGWSI